MMPPRPGMPAGGHRSQRARPGFRRRPGELATGQFLQGILEDVRTRLPEELQGLASREQGALIKFFGDEPAIHYELWLHRSRGRVELGLHFETTNPDRNRRLLEYVAEDLMFLKEALGRGLEAEPWDKGWTRLYISYPIERVDAGAQARLGAAFAAFIETLEPIRREAVAEAL